MPRSANSLTIASRNLGKSDTFFAMMKKLSPDKFDYIASLHPSDIAIAFDKYDTDVLKTKALFEEIYFELVDCREASKFAKYLHSLGIYNSPQYYMSFANKLLGRVEGSVTFRTYLKMKEVIHAYDEFLSEA